MNADQEQAKDECLQHPLVRAWMIGPHYVTLTFYRTLVWEGIKTNGMRVPAGDQKKPVWTTTLERLHELQRTNP